MPAGAPRSLRRHGTRRDHRRPADARLSGSRPGEDLLVGVRYVRQGQLPRACAGAPQLYVACAIGNYAVDEALRLLRHLSRLRIHEQLADTGRDRSLRIDTHLGGQEARDRCLMPVRAARVGGTWVRARTRPRDRAAHPRATCAGCTARRRPGRHERPPGADSSEAGLDIQLFTDPASLTPMTPRAAATTPSTSSRWDIGRSLPGGCSGVNHSSDRLLSR